MFQSTNQISAVLEKKTTQMKQKPVLSSALVFCKYMVRKDTCHPQGGSEHPGHPLKLSLWLNDLEQTSPSSSDCRDMAVLILFASAFHHSFDDKQTMEIVGLPSS